MMKLALGAIASVEAGKWSFGPCSAIDWEPMTNNRKYDGMNDTFIQVAEASVDIFGNEIVGWVPPCTRHEFMQEEKYPIYQWVIQQQTSWYFGLFPQYVGQKLQWVFQDYEAYGYVGPKAPYASQKANGFAYKDADFGRVYYCEPGFLDFWKTEYAYILEWVGAVSPNREAGTSAGIAAFSSLEGWAPGDFASTTHEDILGGPCDYPVQILIGNEADGLLGLGIGPF